jgi:hypothetical protein
MSGFGRKADMPNERVECPLMTHGGLGYCLVTAGSSNGASLGAIGGIGKALGFLNWLDGTRNGPVNAQQ